LFQSSRHLAAFSNAGGSNLSDVENDAKNHTFDPPPVKIRGAVSEISTPNDQTTRIHLMAIHCVAAEHNVLIKKKRKQSSWVKLKAFPTNVRQLKNQLTNCTNTY